MSGAHFTENPFYILGLRPDCSRAELEREGQKLLGLLELGMAAAKTYATPLGPAPRTADRVRQAMAELRDPRRRLMHELWAQLPASPAAAPAATGPAASIDPTERPATGPAASVDSAAPAASGPAASVDPVAPTATASAPATAASGAPPAWPEARAAFGFGARR